MGHGQLITYDPATGNGIVSAEGTRHQFSIERWKSDSVPKIGLMVEVHIQPDGESAEFHPISDVKSALAVNANKLKQGVAGKLATSIIERLGWPLTAAYLFFIGVVFLVPVVGGVAEQTIWDVSGHTWYSKILLLLAMVSVFSPWLRINPKLWRSLATPALTGIYFGIQLADISREIQKMAATGPDEGDGLFGSVLAMAAQYMQVQWEGYAVFLISSIAITTLAFHRFGFRTTTSLNAVRSNDQVSPTEKTMYSRADTSALVSHEHTGVPASRGSRFLAITLDTLLVMAVTMPIAYFIGYFDYLNESNIKAGMAPPLKLTIAIALAGYAVYFAVNWRLLQQKGQTIGKKIMGIRIANLDGSKPNLKSLLIKRYLPLAPLPYIPYAGMALMYADMIWIFSKRRRCLHDIIAGTQVVRA